MRRVCCLVERWESGGIESFLCNVLTQIDLSRLEVDIVAASLGESIFTKQLQGRGVRFFELSGSQRNIPENHRQFRKMARERRWDVLHLNAFHGLSLAYLKIAKEEDVPVRIAHSHNTALRRSLTRPLKLAVHRWAKRRYTRYATALWACSQNAADFLFDGQALKERGFQFIPNGIDVERFRFDPDVRAKVRAGLGVENCLVVGNVGRLCSQKNQTFLLDVFAEVLKSCPDSRLLLVGEGEDRPALEDKARRLGVADKVIFYDTTDHVERLLWAMDVFAFPSLFEGLGIAAVEAQAAGLPVVCSENVPEEASATDQVQVIPLPKGTSTWATAMAASLQRFPDSADAVREAGFDRSDTARWIETCYLRSDVYEGAHNLSH